MSSRCNSFISTEVLMSVKNAKELTKCLAWFNHQIPMTLEPTQNGQNCPRNCLSLNQVILYSLHQPTLPHNVLRIKGEINLVVTCFMSYDLLFKPVLAENHMQPWICQLFAHSVCRKGSVSEKLL